MKTKSSTIISSFHSVNHLHWCNQTRNNQETKYEKSHKQYTASGPSKRKTELGLVTHYAPGQEVGRTYLMTGGACTGHTGIQCPYLVLGACLSCYRFFNGQSKTK